MASLNAAFDDFKMDVGHYLGFTRDSTAWTTRQKEDIERCVKGGLRRFYFSGQRWSFLRPVISLTLAEDSQVVSMPEDFGGIDGKLYVTVSSGTQWSPIPIVGVGQVLQQYSMTPDFTGNPQIACIRTIKGTRHQGPQKTELFVFPKADQDYTVKFQYYLNPDYPCEAYPYAYGGAQHAATILLACQAEAELIIDNEPGAMAMEFEKALAKSAEVDARMKPQTFGRVRDTSDELMDYRKYIPFGDVTFDGVLPS